MRWNTHSDYKDKHAILSASKYHWLRYDDEKIAGMVDNIGAARRGTMQHELAKQCIILGQKLPATNQTLNAYVNDCIGYRMKPETMVFYSPWAFGTADAIDFDAREMILRIYDLKNGKNKASEDQLLVYAAYFCLEYGVNPNDIEEFDLRIYQNDEIFYIDVEPIEILYIMERTKEISELITQRMAEEV
jgi:hypothetical protein